MKDATAALRAAYFDLLNGNIIIDSVAVPVYNKYMVSSANTLDVSAYILLTTVASTDYSSMHTNDTWTTLQVGIYTKDTSANSGETADDIAAQILYIIYPTPQSTIDLMPDFQNNVLKLAGDISPDAIQTDNEIFINRFLTFRHQIFHRPEFIGS